MKREIKFRAFSKGEMHEGVQPLLTNVNPTHVMVPDGMIQIYEPMGGKRFWYEIEVEAIMQYVGLKDKNGKEIFEGDIFRIEEDGNNVDDPDRIFYVVIVWVQEWCMFCSLLVGEYFDYKNNGITSLDEPMFWTYTLEDTNSRKHFLCGNIYANPELLGETTMK